MKAITTDQFLVLFSEESDDKEQIVKYKVNDNPNKVKIIYQTQSRHRFESRVFNKSEVTEAMLHEFAEACEEMSKLPSFNLLAKFQ